MAKQPNAKGIIGRVLNFQNDKKKYEVIGCDNVHYGEKGYVFECICIESPSESMINEEYHFDARTWKENDNNIKVEFKAS